MTRQLRGRNAAPRRSAAQLGRGRAWWALLFIGPAGLGLVVFYLWPTVRTHPPVVHRSRALRRSEFVGIDNYVEVFQNPISAALR